jgi:hypothetical protein
MSSSKELTLYFAQFLFTAEAVGNSFNAWAAKKRHYLGNKTRILKRVALWAKNNRERASINSLRWHHKRMSEKLEYRIEKNLRSRQWYALKAKKCSSRNVEARLGCTVEQFKKHIESQFHSGWTWENWGEVWEIDHIRPCVSFDLTDPMQEKACFHFSNQRPLSIFENRSKGAR